MGMAHTEIIKGYVRFSNGGEEATSLPREHLAMCGDFFLVINQEGVVTSIQHLMSRGQVWC